MMTDYKELIERIRQSAQSRKHFCTSRGTSITPHYIRFMFEAANAIEQLYTEVARLEAENRAKEQYIAETIGKVIKERDAYAKCFRIMRTDKPYETLTGVDFLKYEGETWDRIIMNPPFSRQQDIDNVLKAYEVLATGGILVSVMSTSPLFRTNKKSEAFRAFLDEVEADVIELPDGAFKESGTMVRTCIVKIEKEG